MSHDSYGFAFYLPSPAAACYVGSWKSENSYAHSKLRFIGIPLTTSWKIPRPWHKAVKGVVVPGCPACRKRINSKGDALHSLPFLLDQNKNAVLCVLLERSSRATLRVAPSEIFPTCKPWTSQIGSKFAGEDREREFENRYGKEGRY
jgi:hypothetical protein